MEAVEGMEAVAEIDAFVLEKHEFVANGWADLWRQYQSSSCADNGRDTRECSSSLIDEAVTKAQHSFSAAIELVETTQKSALEKAKILLKFGVFCAELVAAEDRVKVPIIAFIITISITTSITNDQSPSITIPHPHHVRFVNRVNIAICLAHFKKIWL